MVTAAYQFIELHGIGVDDVHEIFVETCETTPNDPELCPVMCDPDAIPYDDNPDTCTLVSDTTQLPRKLVRITAQITSPTTFLSLIGWNNVTLQASAVGETAVIDMALVLDTSESMAQYTCISDGAGGLVGAEGVTCLQDHYAASGVTLNILGDTDCPGPSCPSEARQYPPPLELIAGTHYRFVAGGGPNGAKDANDQNWGYYCNDPNGDGYFDDLVCQPFQQVRVAAANFIEKMDFVRGDRVTIVTFDRYALVRYPDCEYQDPFSPQLGCINGDWQGYPMINDKGVAREVIIGDADHTDVQRRGIGVYVQQDYSAIYKGEYFYECWINRDRRSIDGGDDVDGMLTRYLDGDVSVAAECANTNLGGGIRVANSTLVNPNWKNPAAVWVIVLLTDGAANSTLVPGDPNYEFGFCPDQTILDFYNPSVDAPICRDRDAYTRHILDEDEPGIGIELYDADDYARDEADRAGLAEEGNFIAMFTIGLGLELIDGSPHADPAQPWHGEALLRYVADVGDNGRRDGSGDPEHIVHASGHTDIINDPEPSSSAECENIPHGNSEEYKKWIAGQPNDWQDPSCGNYFFAPDPNNLEPIFAEIASRMFTRVTR
jgi:hypothetical protein